ncbi:hypothetical protein IZ6_18950 [Terrihabitans soli]|uniref:FkbM family methyltransferase n=1 Tax=Terrihabitans soli TaxID=708113 RepID=A0A6S6QVV4_9HYPH|nr:hypothetical protein [Terrihabitans soli]BCJ91160.1 hypothetical protein IZ6_18950 [Terrihabitans soli]
MRKLFLDVGGNCGQTLEEVLKPSYLFDLIYFFEPVAEPFTEASRRFADERRVEWCPFGLSNRNGSFTVYGSGVGMSVYAGKGGEKTCLTGELVSASAFFRDHISEDDLVVMKLNCEGSECDIMNDLLDSGEIRKVRNVMIDFDVRKIPDKAHEEAELMERMRESGFSRYSLQKKVMKGKTHQLRLRNWLTGLRFADQITTYRRSWSLSALFFGR